MASIDPESLAKLDPAAATSEIANALKEAQNQIVVLQEHVNGLALAVAALARESSP